MSLSLHIAAPQLWGRQMPWGCCQLGVAARFPALHGAAGPCGVPGAGPGPAPGGRTLDAGAADSAFGPRRSFCLGCGVSLRQRRGLAGVGAAPSPLPQPAPCPQSCASSEDDSASFRSRAASCAMDSTSEDALSIRSEMIQRKGTWGGAGWAAGGGHKPRECNGIWGTWQENWALLCHGREPEQGSGGPWREANNWG